VDLGDLIRFAATIGKHAGDPGYLWYFDYDPEHCEIEACAVRGHEGVRHLPPPCVTKIGTKVTWQRKLLLGHELI